ncbi:hypothetical protein QYF68_16905 [Mycolicibacterium austroafricanum]|uniref:Integral membrane protein n=1 Tax=Mycolicibacterium austroafricanum TaxID=39687 RepID=A0ABT8HFD5_MYCAO|nr:hypothetical protein [Mycolicibacterium austroafricanum]MDN4519483.1 hypothetical protein [Mycolicibacterium austroafricanum]QZT56687.1 hypothetical protein JN084_27965 [Mycolicibacterium austroafricanum]
MVLRSATQRISPAYESARRATLIRWLRAGAVGLTAMLLMAVPTDVINTPWFSREIPVRWWEYPTLIAMGILTTVWMGIATSRRGAGTAVSGVTLATFAIGCPVCNKLVLAAVGTTGALGLWAPVQPILATVSVTLMTAAVAWRWRQRPCAAGQCGSVHAE